jgi:radical SAM superfamily enzyme YgiQ (UPF0313 family)
MNSIVDPINVLIIAIGDQRFDERQALPLGAAVLKGILQSHGYRVKCIDNALHPLGLAELYTVLEQFHPRVIGLSSTAYFVPQITQIIRQIKSYSIELPVIVGGYCSLVPELVKKTGADAVCHGEGDETVVELVAQFARPMSEWFEDLDRIRGISFVHPTSGEVIFTGHRSLITNLDQFAFPDYSDFDLTEYTKDHWIPFYGQRGCYNCCTFCDIIPFYREQRIRSMTPHRIGEFLETMFRTTGQKYYIMVDDNFMSSEAFLLGLFEDLTRRGLIGQVSLNFQTRANDIIRFRQILPRIKPMIFSIELGLESFADSQLLRYHKHCTAAHNLEAMAILTELNIAFENYYMFLDKETTIEELRTNVTTILSLPPVPYQEIRDKLPEIIINYQYNVWCDLVGKSMIEGIPFLECFEYVLDETAEIRKAMVLYRSLKELEIEIEEHRVTLNEMQQSLLLGMGKAIFPLTEAYARERLELALRLSEEVYNKKANFSVQKSEGKYLFGIHRKIRQEIDAFNAKVTELLSPVTRMGVDLEDMMKFF